MDGVCVHNEQIWYDQLRFEVGPFWGQINILINSY